MKRSDWSFILVVIFLAIAGSLIGKAMASADFGVVLTPEPTHQLHLPILVNGWGWGPPRCVCPSPTVTCTPTFTPTTEPTEEPTEEPTKEPTEEPTKEPTEEPTKEPTEEPTKEPTEEPTEEPIEEPTEESTEAT